MRESKSNLKNIRVLKKNMLFVQSYDEQINKSVLKSQSFFETCGPVQKIKVKQNYKNHTAYVTYKNSQAAATAFIALSQMNQKMKILFGTVQYCKYFIRKSQCRNQHCVFLHLRDKKNQILVNDQIDQDVYDEHYDMAVTLLEDEGFETIKNILSKKEQGSQNLLKKGVRKAADIFQIFPQVKLIPIPQRKSSEIQESLASTTQQNLGDIRDQPSSFEKRPSSQRQPVSKQTKQISSDIKSLQLSTRQMKQDIKTQVQIESVSSNQKKQHQYRLQEYIYIKLIKKLIRENKSQLNFAQEQSHQQYHKRGNMILYKIVKK